MLALLPEVRHWCAGRSSAFLEQAAVGHAASDRPPLPVASRPRGNSRQRMQRRKRPGVSITKTSGNVDAGGAVIIPNSGSGAGAGSGGHLGHELLSFSSLADIPLVEVDDDEEGFGLSSGSDLG